MLKDRLEKIQERIRRAAELAGRHPDSIELLAVSKTKPEAMIREAYELGIRRFGENYVEELLTKSESTMDLDIQWVFIGQLQSRKIKNLMARAHEIQTVASEKHLRLISEQLELTHRLEFPIYLHVNAEDETQKFGMSPQDALNLAEKAKALYPRVNLLGIFSIPSEASSLLASKGETPKVFTELYELAQKIGQGRLSLGMSLDLESAIRSGSSCIRVGSDLFGSRIL